MSSINLRPLDDSIAVSGQILPEDMAAAKARGYAMIVNNRPDGEEPDQPGGAAIAQAAAAAGLGYAAIPIDHAGFREDQVAAMRAALAGATGPVLAFCRSGTRSTFLWALARAGEEPAARLIAKAAAQGYDISGLRPLLERAGG